jgi:hypothetical protein
MLIWRSVGLGGKMERVSWEEVRTVGERGDLGDGRSASLLLHGGQRRGFVEVRRTCLRWSL